MSSKTLRRRTGSELTLHHAQRRGRPPRLNCSSHRLGGGSLGKYSSRKSASLGRCGTALGSRFQREKPGSSGSASDMWQKQCSAGLWRAAHMDAVRDNVIRLREPTRLQFAAILSSRSHARFRSPDQNIRGSPKPAARAPKRRDALRLRYSVPSCLVDEDMRHPVRRRALNFKN